MRLSFDLDGLMRTSGVKCVNHMQKLRIRGRWQASDLVSRIQSRCQHSVRCRCVWTTHVVRASFSAHLAGDPTAV